jgi:Transposase IS66 family
VRRIDAVFGAERAINGLPAEQRLAVRRKRVAPLVAGLEAWMRENRGKLSRHNAVAKAMDSHEGTPRQACSGGHQQCPQVSGVRFKPLTDAARTASTHIRSPGTARRTNIPLARGAA